MVDIQSWWSFMCTIHFGGTLSVRAIWDPPILFRWNNEGSATVMVFLTNNNRDCSNLPDSGCQETNFAKSGVKVNPVCSLWLYVRRLVGRLSKERQKEGSPFRSGKGKDSRLQTYPES